MADQLFPLHLAATGFLTGLIWVVQLVVYPGFAHVAPAAFPAFHRAYTRTITFLVGPSMLLELGTGLALFGRAALQGSPGALAGLLLLAVGLWLRGRFAGLERPARTRRVAHAASLVLALAGLGTALASRGSAPAGAVVAADDAHATSDAYGIPWRAYSRAALDELRAAGTPVFVDFTAAWCLTCKVNEHVVFSSQEVRDAFAARDVAMLRADWTSRDDEITRALASFGRSGVPLYVLYGAGVEPVVLPSVLTRGVVLDALRKIG